MRNLLMTTLATAALGLVATSANALTTYTFDATQVAAFGAGPYGTVTLTQAGANVSVSVTLRSDMNFVNSGGPHSVFAFMVAGATTTDVTNVLFNGSTSSLYTVVAPGVGTPYGTNFSLMIDCTSASCKNGAPGQISDPLTFTVLNALESDFAKTLSNGGAYFAADVISGSATGSIAVTGRTRPPLLPEPGSLALLGLGLLGLGVTRRKMQA